MDRVWLMLYVAVASLMASCTPVGGTGGAQVPVRSQIVEVTMRDHRYIVDEKPALKPGRVVFHVSNQGEADHDLALVKLPDEASGVSDWLDSDVGGFLPVYRMADRASGERGVFGADLQGGMYGMLCFVTDNDGTPHYKSGMVDDFRVERSTPSPAPSTSS
jgi:hypothetical protein